MNTLTRFLGNLGLWSTPPTRGELPLEDQVLLDSALEMAPRAERSDLAVEDQVLLSSALEMASQSEVSSSKLALEDQVLFDAAVRANRGRGPALD